MRLFFALWPPTEATERLFELAQATADQFGGKPTRQETIHLTLAFLGEVPDERLPLAIQTAMRVRAVPFELAIDRLAYWCHNHLVWAGTTLPCAPLIELAAQLQAALTDADFASGDGKTTFTPHLSLVRKVSDNSTALRLPMIEPIHWRCSSFALVRSRLAETGPRYETVVEFPLNQG